MTNIFWRHRLNGQFVQRCCFRTCPATLHGEFLGTTPGSCPARGTKGKAVKFGHGPATVSGGPCCSPGVLPGEATARTKSGWEGQAGPCDRRESGDLPGSPGTHRASALMVPPHTLREKEWSRLLRPRQEWAELLFFAARVKCLNFRPKLEGSMGQWMSPSPQRGGPWEWDLPGGWRWRCFLLRTSCRRGS